MANVKVANAKKVLLVIKTGKETRGSEPPPPAEEGRKNRENCKFNGNILSQSAS